jgi:hypothetical protein
MRHSKKTTKDDAFIKRESSGRCSFDAHSYITLQPKTRSFHASSEVKKWDYEESSPTYDGRGNVDVET